ncbi:hypothetical protein TNCV_981501 [Trichonephila clavipes]|nr:hypothetical protein TNCV_981501 [Trichonephila clavipes]
MLTHSRFLFTKSSVKSSVYRQLRPFFVRDSLLLLSFPLKGQNSSQQRPLSSLSCAMCQVSYVPRRYNESEELIPINPTEAQVSLI